MSGNSFLPLFTGNFRLRLCPEGAAETEAEALQQTDPRSCLPHSGILHSTNSRAAQSVAAPALLFTPAFHANVLALNECCPAKTYPFSWPSRHPGDVSQWRI